jgi:LemA protein
MACYIAIAVAIVVILIPIIIYNRLIALEQTRQDAFADIDVHLKQRCDLIPNLVETVKGKWGRENR